ncbi:hypothetical protein KIPB_002167 [Kipferlia bialata]|uniref:G-protein coupled receptors family 3 profile domain-containing protein n=1 Tax=Kipferlia bialata TaxID=797122 RepID=A0A9K3GG03_9EUKA|nr:hypothetical protein KIPB_002167 [Kipferlia bialata]|eukprot:g2167.t1
MACVRNAAALCVWCVVCVCLTLVHAQSDTSDEDYRTRPTERRALHYPSSTFNEAVCVWMNTLGVAPDLDLWVDYALNLGLIEEEEISPTYMLSLMDEDVVSLNPSFSLFFSPSFGIPELSFDQEVGGEEGLLSMTQSDGVLYPLVTDIDTETETETETDTETETETETVDDADTVISSDWLDPLFSLTSTIPVYHRDGEATTHTPIAVPVAATTPVLYVNRDWLDEHPEIEIPSTWDDLRIVADYARTEAGGEWDTGLCSTFLDNMMHDDSESVESAAMVAAGYDWMVAASKIQYEGAAQGLYIDPLVTDRLKFMSETEAFSSSWLSMQAMFMDDDNNRSYTEDTCPEELGTYALSKFVKGKTCPMYLGSSSAEIHFGQAYAANVCKYHVRIETAMLPGSTEVWDRDSNTMVTCDTDTCPYATVERVLDTGASADDASTFVYTDTLVNRTPLIFSGTVATFPALGYKGSVYNEADTPDSLAEYCATPASVLADPESASYDARFDPSSAEYDAAVVAAYNQQYSDACPETEGEETDMANMMQSLASIITGPAGRATYITSDMASDIQPSYQAAYMPIRHSDRDVYASILEGVPEDPSRSSSRCYDTCDGDSPCYSDMAFYSEMQDSWFDTVEASFSHPNLAPELSMMRTSDYRQAMLDQYRLYLCSVGAAYTGSDTSYEYDAATFQPDSTLVDASLATLHETLASLTHTFSATYSLTDILNSYRYTIGMDLLVPARDMVTAPAMYALMHTWAGDSMGGNTLAYAMMGLIGVCALVVLTIIPCLLFHRKTPVAKSLFPQYLLPQLIGAVLVLAACALAMLQPSKVRCQTEVCLLVSGLALWVLFFLGRTLRLYQLYHYAANFKRLGSAGRSFDLAMVLSLVLLSLGTIGGVAYYAYMGTTPSGIESVGVSYPDKPSEFAAFIPLPTSCTS